MRGVAILLIPALLTIRAPPARHFARTPEQMALMAAGFGCLAVVGGLFGSFRWNLPTGPAIVLAAALLFFSGPYWLPGRKRA